MIRRLVFLVLVTAIALVGYAAYALRIDEVRVTGLHTLSARTVIEASRLEIGQRILWIRLSAATRRVEEIPGVAKATMQRRLPGTVVIHVTERRPLARLDRQPALAIDETGRVFADASRVPLPVVEGWHGKPIAGGRLDAVTTAVLRAFESFPPSLRQRVRRIVVGPPLVLVVDGGIEVRFGDLERLEDKAQAALAVLAAERGKRVAYIDVRAPSLPVVGPVVTPPPATPSATAGRVTPTSAPTPAPTPPR